LNTRSFSPPDNGLIHYEYPLRTDQFTRRPVESLSLSIDVTSRDPIGAIYSPTHDLAIIRDGDFRLPRRFETTRTRPDDRLQPVLWAGDLGDPARTCLTYARAPTRTVTSR
jgi:hypothetical protein